MTHNNSDLLHFCSGNPFYNILHARFSKFVNSFIYSRPINECISFTFKIIDTPVVYSIYANIYACRQRITHFIVPISPLASMTYELLFKKYNLFSLHFADGETSLCPMFRKCAVPNEIGL